MEYKDYYQILGVERSASQDEIKKRYRKLARECHPDTCANDPHSEKRFKEINEAYEVLKDPDKRSRYDALGSSWQQGQNFTPPPGFEHIFGGAPFGKRSGKARSFTFDFGHEGSGGFSDFFESLFGDLGRTEGPFGAASSQNFGGGSPHFRNSAHSPRGDDFETELTISLQEAHAGTSREISLQRPEGTKRLNVKIPPGTTDGTRIRLAGQGTEGPGGAGNLYLRIKLATNGRYRLEGSDLIVDFPITPWDAALGNTSEVETLDGTVRLKIPPGISSGQRLRLKGKGFAHKGDLYAQIKIVMPPQLSPEERRLFEQLKEISHFTAKQGR